jgi:hypothetical protein
MNASGIDFVSRCTERPTKEVSIALRQAVLLSAFLVLAVFTSYPVLGQFSQQGPKLVGTGGTGTQLQGTSVAISADGNTAIVGGYPYHPVSFGEGDIDTDTGAAWVWTRSGGVWTQQGPKLTGSGAVGDSQQGNSVAISADGNTVLVGGPDDNGAIGAAWVWTRTGGIWSQQGNKLVGSDGVVNSAQGISVSLSADGNTALVGGPADNSGVGAMWVWIRNGGVWTQQGNKLVGAGAVGRAGQGESVSLSADGNTAIVGGSGDNGDAGATWVWIRSGGVWTQQGTKLVGAGAVGNAQQGLAVSLSGDGNTAIVGGPNDNTSAGAAWVWTRSGAIWTQQGSKLTVGSGFNFGGSLSRSGDGNLALIGARVWMRSGGVWTQQPSQLAGTGAVGNAGIGSSVALSSDGKTAILGGPYDNNQTGAAWVFVFFDPGSIPSASVWSLLALAAMLALLGIMKTRA